MNELVDFSHGNRSDTDRGHQVRRPPHAVPVWVWSNVLAVLRLVLSGEAPKLHAERRVLLEEADEVVGPELYQGAGFL